MKRTTTLEDVARKAHVSKMTVSRVINHPELVAPELQLVVEDAMHKLNYHPNHAARALATRPMSSSLSSWKTLTARTLTSPTCCLAWPSA